MADMDNFSEINQNFDTIKTLLNSIRAQGILNTSDVDKLLSGINTKLEKINTEEDIDLIKIFLSELKQNLDERHNVLISKFGAIESLFSNLLKNSSEMPKSADIKELFDIVATNLSVFSREVVSQKETLTDITLRLDAIRSDDSQKKDIIKNITLLKPDLERLNNGFDSIVLSLNDNFKTIVKTISTIDKTEYLDRFSDSLNSIEMSSNTVLSALQMLDKKTEQVEDALSNLATKDDITSSNKRLFELTAQSQELSAAVSDLSNRYVRIDNLAEKIDASVNIIAGLKSVLEEADNKHTNVILDQLRGLEVQLQSISSDTKFEEFKTSLEGVLRSIADSTVVLDKNLVSSLQEIQRIVSMINSLDINVSFQNLLSSVEKVEEGVKTSINEVSQKLAALHDANITRVLNDISSGAESLGAKLNQTQSAIAVLCEKNFSSVFENIRDVKNLVSQIDENSVSANNAIFSSITDRLTVFENSLRTSLEAQEKTVNHSSAQLVEQIDNIKNLSNVLDYKMDSSVVEVSNVKREFESLKTAVENVLALDFVSTVKDLRVDLYASKQELVNTFETTTNDLSEKFTNDLYGKYELLISKLDSVADELKLSQAVSLSDLKSILDKISSSIVDVLSYVSESTSVSAEGVDGKISEIESVLKENSLNYVEEVRDVVDVIRLQIDDNLKKLETETAENFDSVKRSISENSEDIKKELKYSYSKLMEIQDSYKEIKEMLNVSSLNSTGKIESIIASAESVKADFDKKLALLKNTLLDKVTEFKQEFTCENADKVSELKFSVENLYNKNSQEVSSLIENLRGQLSSLNTDDSTARTAALAKILDNFVSVKDYMKSLHDSTADVLASKIDIILDDFASIKDYMKSLNDSAADVLASKVDIILDDFASVKTVLDKVDENIDGDMTRQLSLIESNFESLVSQITILFDKSDKSLTDKINEEFASISDRMQQGVSEKLEAYKLKIEESFDGLSSKAAEQSKYLQERIADLNTALKSVWEEQADDTSKQLDEIAVTLRNVIDENIKLTAVDYVALKNKLSDFAKSIETNNQVLTQDLKAQLDDITKYIDSVLDIQAQESSAKYDSIAELINHSASNIISASDSVKTLANEQLELARSSSADLSALAQMCANTNNLIESLDTLSREQQEALLLKEESIYNTAKTIDKTTLGTASAVSSVKSDIASLAQVINANKASLEVLETSLTEKTASLKALTAEISAGELQAIDSYFKQLSELLDEEKQQVQLCKDLIVDLLKKEMEIISKNVEKETDVIIADLIEQFELLKKSQADDVINLTSRMEDIVSAHIYNNIEDLKSYLDIKTDNSVITGKLDNLKIEMTSSVEEIINNLNKLLDSSVFTTAMSDFRVANELLVNSAVDRVNSQIESFISENGKSFEDKLALFDKKFIDTVVDKYEEIKLIANRYNDSFNLIQKSLANVLTEFEGVKVSLNDRIDALSDMIKSSADSTNKEVRLLNECFENLRSQISSKSFDEAFQTSINKQISSLEALINEQMGYIEDINDLCVNNLPDVSELNTLVKYSVLESVKQFSEKLDSYDVREHLDEVRDDVMSHVSSKIEEQNFENRLNQTGADIVSLISDKIDSQDIENRLNKTKTDVVDRLSDKIDSQDIENRLNKTGTDIVDRISDKIDSQDIENRLNQTEADIVDWISSKIDSQDIENRLNQTGAEIVDRISDKIDSQDIENRLNQAGVEIVDRISDKIDSQDIENRLNQAGVEIVNQISDKIESQDIALCLNQTETEIVNKLSDKIDSQEIGNKLNQVKSDIIEHFSDRIESQEIEKHLNQMKADIITQFLNVFNQISFVAEQEEILDFIQDKHDELITVLSHIVTTSSEVSVVKDNLSVIDNKIDTLKDDIALINDKITAIISSDGDIDYVYSLQELESDIASLRLALNEMKENNHAQEFSDLISSTNEIYSLVESIKTELPNRRDFEGIAEDIVSISTRTNKLILASDESYKTLQDNLHDFKLVINDLDERTRNFAQESGMDRLDSKLNAINSMMQSGAKTNQVFNQVFEYLAEWVDKAGVQINAISDRVETLDDIGQIKVMLADLKAEAEDNSESVELIEALGAVFEKQTKRISSLETKLDKIIVETTVNNRNNKVDLTSIENTLNRFLVALDDKMSSQQSKIDSLEAKLEGVMTLLDEKDTAQLTKKVGGMDRQIAKLNKSIEKIASHVVEK